MCSVQIAPDPLPWPLRIGSRVRVKFRTNGEEWIPVVVVESGESIYKEGKIVCVVKTDCGVVGVITPTMACKIF